MGAPRPSGEVRSEPWHACEMEKRRGPYVIQRAFGCHRAAFEGSLAGRRCCACRPVQAEPGGTRKARCLNGQLAPTSSSTILLHMTPSQRGIVPRVAISTEYRAPPGLYRLIQPSRGFT